HPGTRVVERAVPAVVVEGPVVGRDAARLGRDRPAEHDEGAEDDPRRNTLDVVENPTDKPSRPVGRSRERGARGASGHLLAAPRRHPRIVPGASAPAGGQATVSGRRPLGRGSGAELRDGHTCSPWRLAGIASGCGTPGARTSSITSRQGTPWL